MTKSLSLNGVEKDIYLQLVNNQRVQEAQAAVFQRMVEGRLNLEAGAIGTTHKLDASGVAEREDA